MHIPSSHLAYIGDHIRINMYVSCSHNLWRHNLGGVLLPPLILAVILIKIFSCQKRHIRLGKLTRGRERESIMSSDIEEEEEDESLLI